MNLKEETLEKNTIYTGRIITVRNDTALLPNGKRASREVVLGSWSAAKTRWKAASVSCARRRERKRNTFAISANFTLRPAIAAK